MQDAGGSSIIAPSEIMRSRDGWDKGDNMAKQKTKLELTWIGKENRPKLEGFEYAPSENVYWIHGKGTEMLSHLSNEIGPERSLLIFCSAFRCSPGQFSNLTIKKLPKTVLKKCEWDHDEYSLEIQNLPKAPIRKDKEGISVKTSQKVR